MLFPRLHALLWSIRQDHRIARGRSRERRLLRALGEAVAGSQFDPAASRPLAEAAAVVAGLRQQLAVLDTQMRASLDADRRDYNAVGRWMRPVVVTRGLAERAVLRQRAAQVRVALRGAHAALGTAAADPNRAAGGPSLPPQLHRRLMATRAIVSAAVEERRVLLEPWGGSAAPQWARTVAGEGRALGIAACSQTQARLLPRLPAAAGLAAGWWVANTFTDSRWHATWRGLGVGSGGSHLVSRETLTTISIGLPITAAALAAYLSDRGSRWFKRRYAPTQRR